MFYLVINILLTHARDTRTQKNLSCINDVILAPDSVHIISDLYTDDYIESNVSDSISIKLKSEYICFQAAPSKIASWLEDIVSFIKALIINNQQKVVLLPIGYASGHDDYHLLNRIHNELSTHTELLFDLNLWEIMSVIKKTVTCVLELVCMALLRH